MRRVLYWCAAVFFGACLAAEIGMRMMGIIDFPLYHADSKIGYIPKPNQSGSFMRKNDWAFNSRSMAAPEFNGSASDGVRDVLLIGDSIVYGGNPYRAEERLGPSLTRDSKFRIWPISAGSWSLQNELTWLQANRDVVENVDDIVFVLNNGDIAPASSWGCTWTHPKGAPVSAVWFTVAKHLLKAKCEGTPDDLQVPAQDVPAMLQAFLKSLPPRVRVSVMLYPDRGEAKSAAVMQAGLGQMEVPLRAVGVERIVFVGRDPSWASCADCYRDPIHPTPEGNQRLAGIITRHLVSQPGT
jgi:hypothetical protein